MKQTIIILMVFLAAVAKGFSADFDFKNVNSNSAQNKKVTPDRSQIANTQFNPDDIYETNQSTSNSANETMDAAVNLESEKTDASSEEEIEQPRSEMIAGAMGIGIF